MSKKEKEQSSPTIAGLGAAAVDGAARKATMRSACFGSAGEGTPSDRAPWKRRLEPSLTRLVHAIRPHTIGLRAAHGSHERDHGAAEAALLRARHGCDPKQRLRVKWAGASAGPDPSPSAVALSSPACVPYTHPFANTKIIHRDSSYFPRSAITLAATCPPSAPARTRTSERSPSAM